MRSIFLIEWASLISIVLLILVVEFRTHVVDVWEVEFVSEVLLDSLIDDSISVNEVTERRLEVIGGVSIGKEK